MQVTATFLETVFHRFTLQMALKLMLWKRQKSITSFWNRFQCWNFPGRLPGIITELFHLHNFQPAYTSTICAHCQKISGV